MRNKLYAACLCAGLLLFVAFAAGANSGGAAVNSGIHGIAASSAAGLQPAPTPDVEGELKQLGDQAQQKLDQLSQDAQRQLDAQGRRVESSLKDRLAQDANHVVDDLTNQLKMALHGAVGQTCGAGTGALLLLGFGAWAWGRHKP